MSAAPSDAVEDGQRQPQVPGGEAQTLAPAALKGEAQNWNQPYCGWPSSTTDNVGQIAAYYYMMPSPPSGAEYIPANWGPPPAARDGCSMDPAMLPSSFLGQHVWVDPCTGQAFHAQQQQQLYMGMWCQPVNGGASGDTTVPNPEAACFLPPEYEQMHMYGQEQQQMYMAAYQQQQYFQMAAQQPVFVISPPRRQGSRHHQQQQRWHNDVGRLVRKKKAALPAEASYGCEGSFLASAEASIAEDVGSTSATSLARASMDAGASKAQHVRRSSDLGTASAAPAQQTADSVGLNVGEAAAAALPAQRPSIVFDKAPRSVNWRPYSYKDYRQRNYDPKAAGKYWELGGLGPAHGPGSSSSDPHWQAQQNKRERQQQFGQAASKQNRARMGRMASQPTTHRRHACVTAHEPVASTPEQTSDAGLQQRDERPADGASPSVDPTDDEEHKGFKECMSQGEAGEQEMPADEESAFSTSGKVSADAEDPTTAQGLMEEQVVEQLTAMSLAAVTRSL